jgi:hypothetical protein
MATNSNSGYANFNEISYGYGLGNTSMPYSKYYIGFTTTHGYQLQIFGSKKNQGLFCGLGTGLFKYDAGLLAPLYADVRFLWNKQTVSPFVYGESGVIFNIESLSEEMRLFVNLGGGVKIRISKQLYTTYSTGLKVQMGKTSQDSFVYVKIGLAFKPE